MKTEIFSVNELEAAARIIRRGGIVAMPTETVYGLAADALNPESVRSIYIAKGRESDNPLIVHISDISMWKPLVREITEQAMALAKAFWPGPLTIILPKSAAVNDVVSGGLDTVAVRMPSHPAAKRFIELCGCPIAAPSANLSGAPSPTTFEAVKKDMLGRADGIIDGGDCGFGVESTVISLAQGKPRLLRPGAVTPDMLREVLGEIEIDEGVTHEVDISRHVASPGMKYKHYSPKAKVYIVNAKKERYTEFVNLKRGENAVAMCYSSWAEGIKSMPCIPFGEQGDSASQAAVLFEDLRKCDKLGADFVYAPMPSADGVGLAVLNRLLRAAAFKVLELSSDSFEVIGVTGPTGTGKSTVCKSYLGGDSLVIDCDKIAHEVLELPEILNGITDLFGAECVRDGRADRRAIGDKVFSDSEKLHALNSLTHPTICRAVEETVAAAKKAGYSRVVLDAPTLIESGLYRICDRVIYVRASLENRLDRIIKRDSLTDRQARERVLSSAPDEFYLKYADEVIDND